LNSRLGYLHCSNARFGWWDDRATAIEKARTYIDRALAIDPENPDACLRASQLLLLEERWDEAAAYARRAVRLAPNAADSASMACFILAAAGYPTEGIISGQRASTLTPEPPGQYLGNLGYAYRLAGRLEEATSAFEAYHARHPGFGLVDLVIVRHASGQPEDARQIAEQLLAFRPDFTVRTWEKTQLRRDPEGLATDIEALLAAGLPRS